VRDFSHPDIEIGDLNEPKSCPIDEVSLTSDTHGRIKNILVGYEGSQQLPYLRSLMSQMPQNVSFTLLGQSSEDEGEVREYLGGQGIHNRDISYVPLEEYTMKWAQEMVMGIDTPAGPGLVPYMYMLEPDAFKKIIYSEKRYHTVKEGELENICLPRGGWAVKNHDTVFISEGYFDNTNETETSKSPEQMSEVIERISDKRVIPVPPPLRGVGALLFNKHIDMWFTPLGPVKDGSDNVVVVGNPLLGARLANKMGPEEMYRLEQDIFQREISKNESGFSDSQHPIKAIADYILKLPNAEKDLEDFNRLMGEKGYNVVWAPLLALPIRAGSRATAAITYNNIHQQNFIDAEGIHTRDVWIPDYNLPTLDTAGKQLYSNLGFQTHQVKGMEKYVSSHGSLRCLTVIGARGPYKETKQQQ